MTTKKILSYIIPIFVLFSVESIAQSSSGKLSIRENGLVSVFGKHNFQNGSGFISKGKIITDRTGNKGFLNFAAGSSWVGASTTGYVDGYIRVLHNKPFIFPLGDNNQYRPIAISGATRTAAAYYAIDPIQLLGNKPVPKSTSQIKRVSNREYWDIQGDLSTRIVLSWGAESNIANITSGELSNLSICLLYTSPSPRDATLSRMPSSA